jgi:hypothetical protein
MMHVLFLDTMTYLHYKPIEQIDWHEVLGASRSDEVVIVVPGVTLREIDKHKNHTPRLRGRAQRVGAQLAVWLSSDSQVIRPGVRVASTPRAPAVDFAAEGLDQTQNDDVLVATALAYQRQNAGDTVIVVTQDSYPQVVARDHGLLVRTLPDQLKLPDEAYAVEKENRELRRRIQQIESAQPKLSLEFASGSGQLLEVSLPVILPLSEDELAEAMRTMERQFPSADSYQAPTAVALPHRGPPAQEVAGPVGHIAAMMRDAALAREMQRNLLGSIDAEDLKRYAAERSSFLTEYAGYLRELRQFEIASARRFTLDIELVNTGSVPATDVDVQLHVPDGVLVSKKYDLREPDAPEAPARPRRSAEMLFDALRSPSYPTLDALRGPDLSYLSSLADRDIRPKNVSDLDIEETGSFTVTTHVGRVKHGLREALPTIYATIPDDAPIRPFQITYSLHAANVPELETGTLNVLLKAEVTEH